jgi:N-acetyl-gamma-glutamyl-phosphate reductase
VTSETRTRRRVAFRVGIAGASGYAGLELQRLLARHPQLRIDALQARSGGYDAIDPDALARCDVAFLCLPHGASRTIGETLAQRDARVIDLGSDFRVGGWVYGLPELNRDAISSARLVANPGCYATAALLAVTPLVRAGLVDGPIVLDGKSGVTGAGREPSAKTHLPHLHGGITPYSVTGHRHVAEIEQALAHPVTFTPHLLPTSRGLLVTAYTRLRDAHVELDALYAASYADEPFIQLGETPAPQRLVGANTVMIDVWHDARTKTAITIAALDNLVKGAAGQAIQNANLMLGLAETLGLETRGVWP